MRNRFFRLLLLVLLTGWLIYVGFEYVEDLRERVEEVR